MAEHRLTDLINPTKRQAEFVKAVREHRYTLYGGARGGGKSYILRWIMVVLLVDWASRGFKNVRVAIFCEDYPALKDRQISKVVIEFPQWLGKMNHGENEFRLHKRFGAGVICFRNLDDPSKYMSAEFAAMGIDELTKNKLSIFDILRGSLRWPGIHDCHFMGATNPGGIGHLWVKQYFIDKLLPEHLEPMVKEFAFVKALATDNPHNSPEYISELKSLPPKMRRAFFEGDWTVFEGQVLEEWSDDQHIIDDFNVPINWTFACGLDWGMRAPGWFGVFACGPEGDVVCVDELYFKDLYAREAGRQCGELLMPYPALYIAADEQMWYQTGVGVATISEEFQEGLNEVLENAPALIQATHGRGSRASKLQILHRYLAFKWTENEDGTKHVDPWNRPLLRFTRRCKNAIRTLPALPYKDNPHGGPDDVDTKSEDHAYDGITAFTSSRPPEGWEWPDSPGDEDTHPGFQGRHRRLRPYQRAGLEAQRQEPVGHREPTKWEESDGVFL